MTSETEEMGPNEDPMQFIARAAPLIKYSPDTHFQLQLLREASKEILGTLAAPRLPSGNIDGNARYKAHWLFWLWTLGAYEIVRTLCQDKERLTTALFSKLDDLRTQLARLRMPFAKLELAGCNKPSPGGELLAVGPGAEGNDLIFRIEGRLIDARELIEHFDSVVRGVRADQILRKRGI